MAETIAKLIELDELWQQAWESLRQGKEKSRSPFHQGVLATQTINGPEARYVVLRQADQASAHVSFHTDIRSPKVQQLKDTPLISWCFYGEGQQLRLQGNARFYHGDTHSREGWEQASVMSRRAYLTSRAPGSVLSAPTIESAVTLGGVAMSAEENTLSLNNFMLVQIQLTSLEVLVLKSSGHLRALFTFSNNAWQGQWLAP